MKEMISKEEIEDLRNRVGELRKSLTRSVHEKCYSKSPKPLEGNFFIQDRDGTLLEISHRDALKIMDERRRRKVHYGDAA